MVTGRMVLLLALFALQPSCKRSPSLPDAGPPKAEPDLACGALRCRVFPNAGAALEAVLEGSPKVVGIGETHAQKGRGGSSTTRRFTEELLPRLEGRANHLVLELWVANGACGKQEKQVARAQKEVTAPQADMNQNEFVALGEAARRRGMVPHVLVPSCDEYAKILDAGAGDIDTMLQMIGRLSGDKVESLLTRQEEGFVVLYGGAMHNDLSPRPGREAYSYGPRLTEKTKGKYVEVDVIQRGHVGDSEVWRAQPWYGQIPLGQRVREAILAEITGGSYVLFLPEAARSAEDDAGAVQ